MVSRPEPAQRQTWTRRSARIQARAEKRARPSHLRVKGGEGCEGKKTPKQSEVRRRREYVNVLGTEEKGNQGRQDSPGTGLVADPKLVERLMLMELYNDGKVFMALVDSGASINAIDSELLKQCVHQRSLVGRIKDVRGFTGASRKIQEWIRLPVVLPNGQAVTLTLAVLEWGQPMILLGLPFLVQTKATVDFSIGVMTLIGGPVLLHRKQSKGPEGCHQIYWVEGQKMPRLTEAQRRAVIAVCDKFTNVWEQSSDGCLVGTRHTIPVTTKRPVVSRPRQFGPPQVRAIEEEVAKMLRNGIIQRSSSPYSSELVVVAKKTGGWRMCVDYRGLNAITVKDNYPMPSITSLLRSVQASTYFAAFDLRSGYWQILMETDSIPLTAFRCPGGLFEFKVMPFGLTNAPATFQRAMNELLGDLKYKGVSAYLDDILVHSETFEGCLVAMEEVLTRLETAGLRINTDKTNLFPEELEYLGHVLSKEGLKPNARKVEALSRIKTPKNLRELRGILGMLGYYQSFVPNYANHVLPLTAALIGKTKRRDRITWSSDMERGLKTVVDHLKTAILAIPLEGDEFLVETDASDKAIGGILNVKRDGKWAPVEFVAKKLSGPAKRWPTREKEAFAIIHCLRKFDPYLRGRTFTVHTDHQSLKWLTDARTGKIARWASTLAEYDLQIFWKKGTDLQRVDFLSRQVEPDLEYEDRMIYTLDLEADGLPTIGEVTKAQQEEPLPRGRGYYTRDAITFYRNGIWAPPALRTRIMSACHVLPPFCHSGVKKTKTIVLRAFNWAGLHMDVTHYIQGCLPCQRMRPGIERLQGLAKTHPIHAPFQAVYMDIWSCKYGGKAYSVLTMIDQFTKWVEAEVIEDHTAEIISETFLKTWVCRFGVPRLLITDNELGFTGQVTSWLMKSLSISQLRTSPYHPQGNALIESFHRVLNQRLRYFDNGTSPEMKLGTALQLILFSYRSVPHSATNHSPAFMTYGQDPRSPFDQDWRLAPTRSESDRIKFLNLLREDIIYKATKQAMLRQFMNEAQENKVRLKEGDLVLLRASPVERIQAATRFSQAIKLLPSWTLPFRIVKVHKDGTRITARHLLSGQVRDAHVTNLRRIVKPHDRLQRELWVKEFLDPRDSMFTPEQRMKSLRTLWVVPEYPQKRARQDSGGGE